MFSQAGRIARWLLGVLLLTSCQIDISVDIGVAENGSGAVAVQAVFDADATAALGDIQNQLFLDDLTAAGWRANRPQVGLDGSTTVRATKRFASPEQLQLVLDEVAGAGVFTNVAVDVNEQFASRRQTLRLDVDLPAGWDRVVAGADLGDGASIDSLIEGRPLDDVVSVAITATVLGSDDDTLAATVWQPRFDDVEATELRLDALTESPVAIVLRWIAWSLGFLFLLALALAALGIWLERRAAQLRPQVSPTLLTSRIPGEPSASGQVPIPVAEAPVTDERGSVRLVIIEPLAVLYEGADELADWLLPFARHNGAEAPADDISAAWHDLRRGRIDSLEFWSRSGVVTDPSTNDETYIQMRRLRRGAKSFLRQLEQRRIPIAALTDDASLWSQTTRERDRLLSVWPWVVSADHGVVKPNIGFFELLRRESGVEWSHCLYLDNDLSSLELARDLGMRTVYFNPDGAELPELFEHPVVTSFNKLLPRT